MESRASYFLVGLFVLTLSAALLGGLVWLVKFESSDQLSRFEIVYDGTVTGLGVASNVRFAGVSVGEVEELGLHPEDPTQVRIVIAIDHLTPISQDTTATLELEGLTGKRYILLKGGDPNAERMVSEDPKQLPRIPATASSIEQVLEGAPETLESVNLLLAKANDLLGDENRDNLAGILNNLALFTGTLADNREDLEKLIQDTTITMSNLREATDSLQVMSVSLRDNVERLTTQAEFTMASIESFAGNADVTVGEVRRDLGQLFASMNSTTLSLQDTLNEVQGLVAENRVPIRDFTGSGLYEVSSLLIELRSLIKQFNRVTTEVERDPARFLFGNSNQGYDPNE